MSEVTICRGGAADLPAIMPVMAAAFGSEFGEAWTEAQCLGVVSMPGSQLIIGRQDVPVAFALSRIVIDESELMLLAVAPDVQRTGIGRRLLAAMIDNSRAEKVSSIFLEVRAGNPATTLYAAAGFTQVGRRRGYYRSPRGETFDALTYRLALT